MFFFRVNRVGIFKNRESALFPWDRDEAEIELWSFITTDNVPLPDMSDFINTSSGQKRKEMVTELTKGVLESRKIAPISHVKDNQVMTFGDTGYVLFQSLTIPEHFNWNFLAIELDEPTRSGNQLLQDVVKDAEFDKFTDNLVNALVKTPMTPGFQALVSIGRFVTNVVMKRLSDTDNDLVGVVFSSFNRQEHYPHGERKRDRVPDLTNNMWVDYSMFGVENKPM